MMKNIDMEKNFLRIMKSNLSENTHASVKQMPQLYFESEFIQKLTKAKYCIKIF